MVDLDFIKEYLKKYDGPEMNIMEVCGSHSGAIAKNGIPGLLSPKIRLISGPGCPVCVTPSAYIDRLIELSLQPDTCVTTFGDMLRVPGSRESLAQAKGRGAHVKMVYSPMDTLDLAAEHPDTEYIFAAIGFETTTPVYALLLDELIHSDIQNVKLLTSLKTMPPVISRLCASGADIQGFLAPGHVSVVTGYKIFEPIADKYQIPFGVAGFTGELILTALYGIVRTYEKMYPNAGKVMNFYPSVVTREGNTAAQSLIDKYFGEDDAVWRGMGTIPGSGRVIRHEYERYDAGSRGLTEDHKKNAACRCDQVLMGKIKPTQCPLYGKSCTPLSPQGACMVSAEGNCSTWYVNHRTR